KFIYNQLERSVIVHIDVYNYAAVSVIGIFAQTDVRDDQKRGNFLFDRADRMLHITAIRVGLGAEAIFVIGKAEKNNRGNTERVNFVTFSYGAVNGELKNAGHR